MVLDQAYAILTGNLPAGYYAAVSPDVDSINVECYIHSEDDLPEPEPEEDEEDDESDQDASTSGAAPQTAAPHNQTQTGEQYVAC